MAQPFPTSFQPIASPISNCGTQFEPLHPYTEQSGDDGTAEYESITALSPYSNYSHEELRLADYQLSRGGKRAENSAQKHPVSGFMAPPLAKRDQAHLNLFRGAAIRVCVGPCAADPAPGTCQCNNSWHLPTALISHSSSFLRAACTRDFKERKENRIGLPDDDPTVFAMYVEWLYYGGYTVPIPRMFESDPELISIHARCYIMGDKLLDVEFKNYAMNRLFLQYMAPANLARAMTTHEVRFVLENTAPGSKLRQFHLHLAVQHFGDPLRSKDTTEMWDELLLDHSDARLLLLQSFRLAPAQRNLVQPKEHYMHQEEPPLEALRNMEIK